MMRIRGSVGGECLRSALQGGWGPVLEALRDRLLGSPNQERNGNQRQQVESLHSFSPRSFVRVFRSKAGYLRLARLWRNKKRDAPRKGAPILPLLCGVRRKLLVLVDQCGDLLPVPL